MSETREVGVQYQVYYMVSRRRSDDDTWELVQQGCQLSMDGLAPAVLKADEELRRNEAARPTECNCATGGSCNVPYGHVGTWPINNADEIRRIHRVVNAYPGLYCLQCGTAQPWPCDTIKALAVERQ